MLICVVYAHKGPTMEIFIEIEGKMGGLLGAKGYIAPPPSNYWGGVGGLAPPGPFLPTPMEALHFAKTARYSEPEEKYSSHCLTTSTSQTDKYLVILSSKTCVFEDNLTQY